jgi:hypothetical protein
MKQQNRRWGLLSLLSSNLLSTGDNLVSLSRPVNLHANILLVVTMNLEWAREVALEIE